MLGTSRVWRTLKEVGSLTAATLGVVLLTEQFEGPDGDEAGDAASESPDAPSVAPDAEDTKSRGQLVVDGSGDVLEANAVARRLLAPRKVDAGVSLAAALPEVAVLLASERQRAAEVVVDVDGVERVFDVTYVPFDGEHGCATGVLAFHELGSREGCEGRDRELVANATDVCLILDADAAITFAGGSLEGVLGYEPDDVVGEDIFGEVHPEDHGQLREHFEAVMDDPDATRRFEYRIRTAAGEWRIQEGVARNAAGTPFVDGVVVNSRDVTERRRRERELERRNEDLEEFAEMVSHDIRNPLQVAKGHLEQAQETGDVVAFEHAKDAHDRIEALIEDVLALAGQGETVEDAESISLESVAREGWQTVDTKGMQLDVEGDWEFEGDRARVRQLFENLYRNTAEHAGPTATVTVGSIEPSHTNTRIDVETPSGFFVADDGPGVPEDERGSVFESGYTTATEGTGFGLAIAAKIADAHVWEASVTNGRDGGARFEFVQDVDEAPYRS